MQVEFPILVSEEEIRAATEWHSGQWSAFYSLASTGNIHDWYHVSGLQSELRDAQRHGAGNDDGIVALDHRLAMLSESMPYDD